MFSRRSHIFALSGNTCFYSQYWSSFFVLGSFGERKRRRDFTYLRVQEGCFGGFGRGERVQDLPRSTGARQLWIGENQFPQNLRASSIVDPKPLRGRSLSNLVTVVSLSQAFSLTGMVARRRLQNALDFASANGACWRCALFDNRLGGKPPRLRRCSTEPPLASEPSAVRTGRGVKTTTTSNTKEKPLKGRNECFSENVKIRTTPFHRSFRTVLTPPTFRKTGRQALRHIVSTTPPIQLWIDRLFN